jgi:hypothetical protein
VRTVAYKAVASLEITYGEYQALCDCCTTLCNTSAGVLPKAKYDNKVRDLVLGRILEDGMSIERTLRSLRREFLLGLSSGSSMTCSAARPSNSTWPLTVARC